MRVGIGSMMGGAKIRYSLAPAAARRFPDRCCGGASIAARAHEHFCRRERDDDARRQPAAGRRHARRAWRRHRPAAAELRAAQDYRRRDGRRQK